MPYHCQREQRFLVIIGKPLSRPFVLSVQALGVLPSPAILSGLPAHVCLFLIELHFSILQADVPPRFQSCGRLVCSFL